MRNSIKKINLRPFLSGLLPLFFFAHLGHHIVGAMLRPLMPMIRTDLGLSYTRAGVAMSAYQITNGVSQLPSGWLADRFGPRFLVLLGVAGVATAGILIGLSHSYVALIAFLVLAALLGGGYHPASASAVSTSVSSEYRGRALGFHSVGGTSAFWIVPLLAAPISIVWGWNGSFLALSIPTVILGIVLFILISRLEKTSINASKDVGGMALKGTSGIPWRRLGPFILISVISGTIVASVLSYLSLYAVDSLGVSDTSAAMLMAINPAVGFFAAPLGGYLSDRFGSIKVVLVTSFLCVPLIYLLGMTATVGALVVLMVAIGIVSIVRMPTSESFIAGNTPAHRRATVLGLYFFSTTEFSGLLTPVLGILIDQLGFSTSFAISSALIAVAVVACSPLLWRDRNRMDFLASNPPR